MTFAGFIDHPQSCGNTHLVNYPQAAESPLTSNAPQLAIYIISLASIWGGWLPYILVLFYQGITTVWTGFPIRLGRFTTI